MGTNEFNSDSIVGETDGGNRDPDDGAEGLGATLAAVGDAQRELAGRIAELERSVGEYAEVVAQRRESRTQRAKDRSSRIAGSIERGAPEVGESHPGANSLGNSTDRDGSEIAQDRSADSPKTKQNRNHGMEL